MTATYPTLHYFKAAPQADKIKAVGNWLRELEKAGLLWHMDDPATDIESFIDQGIAEGLERERQKAIKICDTVHEGIWGLKFWAEYEARELAREQIA